MPQNLCPCPHWGTVLKGSIHVTFADGSVETVKAGEVYYLAFQDLDGETLQEKLTRDGALPVDEAIEICKRLWVDERIEHQGEFFSFDEVAFEVVVQHRGDALAHATRRPVYRNLHHAKRHRRCSEERQSTR